MKVSVCPDFGSYGVRAASLRVGVDDLEVKEIDACQQKENQSANGNNVGDPGHSKTSRRAVPSRVGNGFSRRYYQRR